MPSSTIARHVSRAKAERLVASGRLIICTIAVVASIAGFAARRDPHALALTASWWAVAAMVMWSTSRRAHPRTTPLVLVFDLLVIAVLLMTTGGATSVYFPFIVLPPFGAHLLYARRAIVGVAVVIAVIYFGAVLTTPVSLDPRMVIIRLGIVVLVGATVFLRREYEERIHRDVESLATWPRSLPADRDAAVRELLGRAAMTLRTLRSAVMWDERDGSMYFAKLEGERFEIEEEPLDALIAPDLADASAFLAPGLRRMSGAIETWSGPFVTEAFTGRFPARSLIGARFASQTATGWLFLADVRRASADDVMLAEVVARLVSAGLDQINLAEMVRERAASAERIRLSRDLHDGLLQSLSGLALHAQGARRAIESDPRGAEERLEIVVRELADGQRALRDFVDELRPELLARREPLPARLESLARSLEGQWNVAIEIDAEIDGLPKAQSDEVVALLSEAVTNAAKHAGAQRIQAVVRLEIGSIRIDVEDDGRGFPFHGRYELPQLVADQRGPWSLRERVSTLGGELAIESSSRGARVEIRLPLPA